MSEEERSRVISRSHAGKCETDNRRSERTAEAARKNRSNQRVPNRKSDRKRIELLADTGQLSLESLLGMPGLS